MGNRQPPQTAYPAWSKAVAFRVWSQPYSVNEVKTVQGKQFRLINLPFYLIGELSWIISTKVFLNKSFNPSAIQLNN